MALKNIKGLSLQAYGSPVTNSPSFENQCKVGHLWKRLLATGVKQMAWTACHLKEHFISYRIVANMFTFVHFTGVASLGEMWLKTPYSSLIFSVPNCPIGSKLLPNNIKTYYYKRPKLHPDWTCNWYANRCQSWLKVEMWPTLSQFCKVSCTSKKFLIILACRETFY